MDGIKANLINEIVDLAVQELKKEQRQNAVRQHVLDPLLSYVIDRLKPYLIVSVVLVLALFIVLLVLIYVILTSDFS